jgi:N-glycosylase/DNA lyase
LTIDELTQIYDEKRDEITARLAEFTEIGRAASDERLFEELTFCIFTAASSARMGLKSVESLRPVLMTGSKRQIQRALTSVHRWPRSRGAYVYETREYLRKHHGLGLKRGSGRQSGEGPGLRGLFSRLADSDLRRDFFAANPGVRGLGYKEASHYLRNVGFTGYAILDKHVLSRLAEFGVIDNPKPASTKAKYLGMEEKMKKFAEQIGINFDELDLLLWYTKTGEILK